MTIETYYLEVSDILERSLLDDLTGLWTYLRYYCDLRRKERSEEV